MIVRNLAINHCRQRDLGSNLNHLLDSLVCNSNAKPRLTMLTKDQTPTPLEAYIRELEQPHINEHIRGFCGETVLWVGQDAQMAEGLKRCMVRNSFLVQPHMENAPARIANHADALVTDGAGTAVNTDIKSINDSASSSSNQVVYSSPVEDPIGLPTLAARLQQLPFPNASVDGIVLHHALEACTDPRIALREVNRVLAPGGRLMVLGYNCFSPLVSKRWWSRVQPNEFSRTPFINPIRMFDWLTLLGFELEQKPVYFGQNLPLVKLSKFMDSNSTIGKFRQWLEAEIPFGGVFLVTARKQVAASSFTGGLGQKRSKLAPVAYPRVASWRNRREL